MNIDPVTIGFSIAASAAAYLCYIASGPEVAVAAFLGSMTVLMAGRAAGISDSMSVITHPFVSFFPALIGFFIYFGIQGGGFWGILVKSLGYSFIWGAASMIIFNIWNL